MSLPVTGNFRPILTSIFRFSASYKSSHSFLKSFVIFSIRADSFFDAFVFFITFIFDGQTIEVPFPCPNERIATASLNPAGSRDQTSLAPLRAGWTRLRLCAHPSRKIHPPPRQTFSQRERPASRKTGLPQVPTRPAPPPLRSPHPSLHSASKVSSLLGIGWPETAKSCHYREKSGASRPWQFSADSGQDKKTALPGAEF